MTQVLVDNKVLIIDQYAPILLVEGVPQAVIVEGPTIVYLGTEGPTGKTGPNGSPLLRTLLISGAGGTIHPDITDYDMISVVALANVITIGTPSYIAAPQDGTRLLFRFIDNGTPQSIVWDSIYVSGGPPLPTSTVAGKTMHLGFMYDAYISKWMLIASTTQS